MPNNCTGAIEYGDIIYYSHLIPISISIVLIFFILKKTKFSFLSSLFSVFVTSFCIWLIFDFIAWISTNYNFIVFSWSLLDLINILFYLLGLYFLSVFIYGKDINFKSKIYLFLLVLPAWIITILGNSIMGFDEVTCEVINNTLLTYYKLIIEIFVVLFIISLTIYTYIKSNYTKNNKQIITVSSSLITFLLIFSITEFISSKTGIYEINLYGLFILPIFLFIIIFATTSLGIFKVRIIGTQLLGYVIITLVISQLFFYKQSSDHLLDLISSIILISFSLLLIKNSSSEEQYRQKISFLSSSLSDLNANLENKVLEQTREITRSYELEKKALRELEKFVETKDNFLMIAQHNLRIPIVSLGHKIKSVVNSDAGKIDNEIRRSLEETNISIQHLVQIADDFKNMAEMKVGSNILNLSTCKIRPVIESILEELRVDIENMKLNIDYPRTAHDSLEINIDSHKIREVLFVVLENAIRYNIKNGSIRIITEVNERIFKIQIHNTGLGITKDEKDSLFSRSFYRSKRAKVINPVGMGIGLLVSKTIVQAHHGDIAIDSEGENKGVLVNITLPLDFLVAF